MACDLIAIKNVLRDLKKKDIKTKGVEADIAILEYVLSREELTTAKPDYDSVINTALLTDPKYIKLNDDIAKVLVDIEAAYITLKDAKQLTTTKKRVTNPERIAELDRTLDAMQTVVDDKESMIAFLNNKINAHLNGQIREELNKIIDDGNAADVNEAMASFSKTPLGIKLNKKIDRASANVAKESKTLEAKQEKLNSFKEFVSTVKLGKVVVDGAFDKVSALVEERNKLAADIRSMKQEMYIGGKVIKEAANRIARTGTKTPPYDVAEYFTSNSKVNVFSMYDDTFGVDFIKVVTDANTEVADILAALRVKTRVNSFKGLLNEFVANGLDTDTVSLDTQTNIAKTKGDIIKDFQGVHRMFISSPKHSAAVTENGTQVKRNIASKLELDDRLATIMAVAGVSWLADMKLNRSEHRTDDQINTFINKPAGSIVTDEEHTLNAAADILTKNAAAALGRNINEMLGIKATSGNEAKQIKLEMELGLLVIGTMQAAKILEETKIDATELYGVDGIEGAKVSVLNFTSIGDKLLDSVDNPITLSATMLSKLVQAPNKITRPRLDAPADIDREVRNDAYGEYFDLTEDHIKAIHSLEHTPYKVNNEYVDSIYSMTEDEETLERFKVLLGKKDPTDVHRTAETGIISKNNLITRNINQLIGIAEDMGAAGVNTMWFDYKVIATDRFYMVSNVFNPQALKLHRFGVYNEAVDVTEDNHDMLQLAFAQAFGVKVDKMLSKSAMKKFKVVEDKLIAMIEDGAADIDILEKLFTKDVEHALLGVVEYRLYHEYKKENGGSYVGHTAYIGIETDATTSGHANKNAQFPVYEDVSEAVHELKKVGIYTPNAKMSDGSVITSAGQVKEDPMFKDSYEEPADLMTKNMATYDDGLANLISETMELAAAKTFTVIEAIARIKELSTETDFKEAINSIDRAFMKDPFMTFGYGAAINTIITAMGKKAVEQFYNLIVSVKDTTQVIAILESLEYFHNVNSDEIDEAITAIHENSGDVAKLRDIMLHPTITAAIRSAVRQVLGAPLRDAFESKYGVSMLVGRTINTSIVTMQELFIENTKIAIEIEEFRLGAVPSEAVVTRRMKYLPNKTKEEVTAIIAAEYTAVKRKVLLSNKQKKDLVAGMTNTMPAIRLPNADKDSNQKMLIVGFEATSLDTNNTYIEDFKGTIRLKPDDTGKKYIHADGAAYSWSTKASAGLVNSIQSFDSAHMAPVLMKYKAQSIHDATINTINNALPATAVYNKATFENNVNNSLGTTIVEAMHEVIANVSAAAVAAVNQGLSDKFDEMNAERLSKNLNAVPDFVKPTVRSILRDMEDLRASAETAREAIFDGDILVEHATLEGSAHSVKGYKYTRPDIKLKQKDGSYKTFGKGSKYNEVSYATQNAYLKVKEKEAEKNSVGRVVVRANVKDIANDEVNVGFTTIFENPFGTKFNPLVVIEDFKKANLYYYKWLTTNSLEAIGLDATVMASMTKAKKAALAAKKTVILKAINDSNSNIRTKKIALISSKAEDEVLKYDNVARRLIQVMLKLDKAPVTLQPNMVQSLQVKVNALIATFSDESLRKRITATLKSLPKEYTYEDC